MAKFKKKPVVIDAEKWSGHEAQFHWIAGIMLLKKDATNAYKTDDDCMFYLDDGVLKIETLEGVMTADVGDFIIKGVQGELYPCKSDIFNQTYEPAE